MFDGIFNPAFLQSACAHAITTENIIRLHVASSIGYDIDLQLSYSGTVIISYIDNGIEKTKIANTDRISFPADANTYIIIKGNVSLLTLTAPPNQVIDAVYATETKALMSLTPNAYTKELQLSKYLTYLKVNGTRLTSISYPANNNAVSTAIADAITGATANNGTVYTNPDGKYYDIIAQAATAKGWNIVTSNEQ